MSGRKASPTPQEAAAIVAALDSYGVAAAAAAEATPDSAWRIAARREGTAPFVGPGETR